ncbi:ABC transporter permease subunit [Flavimobilis sp. GY10621]|uniref:ABC transporter permease subunit n=1 Tax=Flavimobilis rhizosphaerae TaxID=2775421 RepID=A0ABR9DUI2_9MICO|nr:ABC transporter permease subunit [Flavimobilis rhizosphaerae]MBD9699670.1 ABC transporter permease subunit [Flavimobilis rhizosphaerae]
MTAASPLFDAPGPRTRRIFAFANVTAVLGLAAGLAWVVWMLGRNGQLAAAKWTPFLEGSTWVDYLLPGLLGTLGAAAISVVLAGVLGVVLGLGRLSENRWISGIAGAIVEFFRAVPVLLMMVFSYWLLVNYRLVPSDQLALTAVVISLTVYNGSVVAELVRSGITSLPRGQREAGLSIGLTHGQTVRTILLPQGVVAMLPALVSQLVVVVKDSALGYLIGYAELLRQAEYLATNFANYIPAVIVIAAVFILVNLTVSLLADRLALRLRSRTSGAMTTQEPGLVAADD